MAWRQQQLVDTAFDRVMIKDLKPEVSFQVDQDTTGDIFFITGDLETLYIGSEHRLWGYSGWLCRDTNNINSVEKMNSKLLFECKSPSTITDVKKSTATWVSYFVLLSNGK
nr:ADM_HP1_G0047010.mRNA.1.CDS.1 [Saccharomyces cerevisiae]